MRHSLRALLAVLAASVALPAVAADIGRPAYVAGPVGSPWDGSDFLVDIGAGVLMRPQFEGASKYEAIPWIFGNVRMLRNPFTGERKSADYFDDRGFSFTPAFRTIGSRRGTDVGPGLGGLGNIDSTFELGGKIEYRWANVGVFVEGRQGIGGHNGFLVDLGVDLLTRPTARTEFTVGPRVTFATADYMQTYFGVTPGQAAATGLPVYGIGGGLRSAGVGATAAYWLTDRWALRGEASWSRLLGDIKDSPILAVSGDIDQFTASVGLSYRFGYSWPGNFR